MPMMKAELSEKVLAEWALADTRNLVKRSEGGLYVVHPTIVVPPMAKEARKALAEAIASLVASPDFGATLRERQK